MNGTLALGNNDSSSGQQTIVAKKTITVSNNSVINIPNTPVVISEQGDIIINNQAQVGGYLHAPNGSITLDNRTGLTGAAAAETVTVLNQATLTHISSGRSGLPGLEVKTFNIVTP